MTPFAIKQAQRPAHANCVFSEPLGIECRYCGFAEHIHEEDEQGEPITPRKLAPPAAMRAIRRLSESASLSSPSFSPSLPSSSSNTNTNNNSNNNDNSSDPNAKGKAKAKKKISSRLSLRGTDIIVDVCSGKPMIVLVSLKGILELCAEALEDEDVVLASPTTLSTRLGGDQLKQTTQPTQPTHPRKTEQVKQLAQPKVPKQLK